MRILEVKDLGGIETLMSMASLCSVDWGLHASCWGVEVREAFQKVWAYVASYTWPSSQSPGLHALCMEKGKMTLPNHLPGVSLHFHNSAICTGTLKISACWGLRADGGKNENEKWVLTPSSHLLHARPCPGYSHTFSLFFLLPSHNRRYFCSCGTQEESSSGNVKWPVPPCLWVAESGSEPRDFWIFPEGLAAVYTGHSPPTTCMSQQLSLPPPTALFSTCSFPSHPAKPVADSLFTYDVPVSRLLVFSISPVLYESFARYITFFFFAKRSVFLIFYFPWYQKISI